MAALWPTWRRFPQARTKPKLHSLIALVVTIIILVLVLGLLQYVLNLFPPTEPLGNVLRVVVVIIAVLVVIGSCSISGACRSARAPVCHGSHRMSWSNPQVVGKVAGEEIVAELGDGLGPSGGDTEPVGTTLSCTKGTWSNADDVQTAYQRERDEETIEGATGDEYTTGDDDEDCALRCWVRVKNAAGAARAVSNEVTIVAAALPEQHGAQKKGRLKAPLRIIAGDRPQ